jgi:hypothetical protein
MHQFNEQLTTPTRPHETLKQSKKSSWEAKAPKFDLRLAKMRESQNLPWDKRLEIAFANYDLLVPTLDGLKQEEWNAYIDCIVKDELPFDYDRGQDNDYLSVKFCSARPNISQSSKDKISQSIAAILKQSLEADLSDDKNKELHVAFNIAYDFPIIIQDRLLLKEIALKQNIPQTHCVYSCILLIVETNALDDIEWWESAIQSENGKYMLPTVFDSVSEKSNQIAINFLNKFKCKISGDNMNNTVYRFLGKIIKEGESDFEFTLNSFPESLHDYIKRLLTLHEFKPLRDAWGIEETK